MRFLLVRRVNSSLTDDNGFYFIVKNDVQNRIYFVKISFFGMITNGFSYKTG